MSNKAYTVGLREGDQQLGHSQYREIHPMASASVVSDAEYVCTLDEKSAKKAKEELNEDPKNRLGAVETFRQWILQQPHIKCPTDILFLLPFLRCRYFSQLEARKLLENFLARRAKFFQWFRNLDPADPKIQAVIDTGFFLLLPHKDDDGRQMILVRPGTGDITKIDKVDVFRTFACLIDYIYFLDERASVNGTVSIIDFSHYSMKIHTYVSIEERRDFMHTWQANYPARVKQVHMINAGTFMEILMNLTKFIMPEKIQQRLKVHSTSLETLYKDIPMRLLPAEYLPDEYEGPHAGTEREIIDRTKSLLLKPEVRSRIQYLSSDQFGIDDKKKPKDDKDVPQGSFRKLNID